MTADPDILLTITQEVNQSFIRAVEAHRGNDLDKILEWLCQFGDQPATLKIALTHLGYRVDIHTQSQVMMKILGTIFHIPQNITILNIWKKEQQTVRLLAKVNAEPDYLPDQPDKYGNLYRHAKVAWKYVVIQPTAETMLHNT